MAAVVDAHEAARGQVDLHPGAQPGQNGVTPRDGQRLAGRQRASRGGGAGLGRRWLMG